MSSISICSFSISAFKDFCFSLSCSVFWRSEARRNFFSWKQRNNFWYRIKITIQPINLCLQACLWWGYNIESQVPNNKWKPISTLTTGIKFSARFQKFPSNISNKQDHLCCYNVLFMTQPSLRLIDLKYAGYIFATLHLLGKMPGC